MSRSETKNGISSDLKMIFISIKQILGLDCLDRGFERRWLIFCSEDGHPKAIVYFWKTNVQVWSVFKP